MTFQIVLAKLEETVEAIEGQWTTSRGDGINPVAKLRTKPVAKACVWLKHATHKDMAKASALAKQEGWTIYTFASDDRDPLERAKAHMLKQA